MTIDGLEKMLRQEVKLSNQQINFNEVRGHDDQYERGYRDALKMVIKNLAELPKGESIPVEWIEMFLEENYPIESPYGTKAYFHDFMKRMIKEWEKENANR